MNFVAKLFIVAVVGFACSFLIAGCRKSSVDAVPRISQAKPVFGVADSQDNQKKSGDINFDFVHPDHFACLSIDVQRIIARKELKEFPWDSVEVQLADLVGNANADLNLIERIWLLLDRESAAAAMEGKTEGFFVTVIQYQSPLDTGQLAAAKSNQQKSHLDSPESDTESSESEDSKKETDEPTEELNPPRWKPIAQAIGERRIAIGSKLDVDKLKASQNPAENSELSRLLAQLDFSSDVEGVIATGPVRETLKSVFGIAAQFGGKEAKKFAALPDVLEQIEIRFSLEQGDPDLLSVKAMIDDKRMIDEVVSASQQAIEQSNANTNPNGPALEAMFGQEFRQSRDDKDSVSAKIAEEVSREIKEKNLFSVEGNDDSVSFRLGRPTKISELMRALVEDLKSKRDPKTEKEH